jgi:phosphatidylglycerol:prolipoprotein diacylglycerol transferase
MEPTVGPLIPFIKAPELPLTFLTWIPGLDRLFDAAHPPSIKPFGTLVALGVYIGSVLTMRHGRERGVDEKKLSEFIFWTVGIGFVGGHVLDAIFYHPDEIARDPLYIVKLWAGLSSYGGFIGAITGILLWKWRRKQSVLAMSELVASCFPLAWVFGRAGCATVHDHPGMLSDAWYAVRWPMPGGAWSGAWISASSRWCSPSRSRPPSSGRGTRSPSGRRASTSAGWPWPTRPCASCSTSCG